MIKNNTNIVFNPKNLVLVSTNPYDRVEINKRSKNTFFNKIVNKNNIKIIN
jgi:hypothetical protein